MEPLAGVTRAIEAGIFQRLHHTNRREASMSSQRPSSQSASSKTSSSQNTSTKSNSRPASDQDAAFKVGPGSSKGNGGELHQLNVDDIPTLTTQQGGPVSDNQNTLSAGPRGHLLLEDHVFREKMFHFDHERIPERVVHARGYGAHGFFENYDAGCMNLSNDGTAEQFIASCRQVRFWDRMPS